ncbi:ABC-type multidrug transport system, ATPase and permease component [Marinitoga piezophila KA3]|uniref:ABC-type multidrug transport system, ATPase and permease component n=1 Tax=Marinitoga piezophila (strain DSM 14283 / JCM 11233 / KA3) TaxID=443254 RepID=H2J7G8_MARPK|nr:ABC transporter transmembrane domain-containing protein [Marinitoga piezophila]AEX86461.1 ABC-type multidrug transport system, ATPase and permease component [Marinitoga piezophila KA3]
MKKIIFVIIVLSIISIISEYLYTTIPLYTKDFIDFLTSGIINYKVLLNMTLIIIISFLLKTMVKIFLEYYKKKASYLITIKGLSNILKFDYLEFKEYDEIYYSESLLRLPEKIMEAVSSSGMENFTIIFKMIFLIIFIFNLDIKSGIATIIYTILSFVSIWISNKYFYENYDKQIEINLNNISDAMDQLEGLKEIHLFNTVNSEISRFENNINKYRDFSIKINILDWLLSFTINDFFQYSIYAYLIYRGLLLKDVGSLIALYMYVKDVANIMNNSIFGIWNSLREALISWNRLKKYII